MHKAIVVFEVEGGNDKGDDGHRKDTMPIVNSIMAVSYTHLTLPTILLV